MKQQSDLVRDITDPGWREREAAMHKRIIDATQVRSVPNDTWEDIKATPDVSERTIRREGDEE